MDAATEFRRKLIEEVYPELKLYLNADEIGLLAANLKVSVQAVRAVLDEDYKIGIARKVVRGEATRNDGKPNSRVLVDRVWHQLQILNNNPSLTERTTTQAPSYIADCLDSMRWYPREGFVGGSATPRPLIARSRDWAATSESSRCTKWCERDSGSAASSTTNF